MTDIKYDFNSCYNAYDFLQFYNEEVTFEDDLDESIPLQVEDELHEVSSFYETVEDILKALLVQSGIEFPQPPFVRSFVPKKLLITLKNKERKTLPLTPKNIFFNKTKMAKHPNIEIDTVQIFKSVYDMGKILNSEKLCREHLEQLRWNGEPI